MHLLTVNSAIFHQDFKNRHVAIVTLKKPLNFRCSRSHPNH